MKLTHEMSLMQGSMRDIEDKLHNEQELSERLRAEKLRADMELSRLAIEAAAAFVHHSQTDYQLNKRVTSMMVQHSGSKYI